MFNTIQKCNPPYIKTNQPSIGKRTKTKITNFILRKMSPTKAKKISNVYRKIVNKSPSKYHQYDK